MSLVQIVHGKGKDIFDDPSPIGERAAMQET